MMNNDDRQQRKMRRGKPRRKICAFCADKSKSIDYKDTMKLKRFLTERGKNTAAADVGRVREASAPPRDGDQTCPYDGSAAVFAGLKGT